MPYGIFIRRRSGSRRRQHIRPAHAGAGGFKIYADAAREYVEANGELAAFHVARGKADDALAIYKAMVGDTEKIDSNPATCCIRVGVLVDPAVLALYAGRLGDYHRLLLERRMTQEAENGRAVYRGG